MQLALPPRIASSDRLQAVQERMLVWLRCGLQPRQLAFTLALGFAIGCIPLLGVTTGICALLALLFGLNMPAIQAANWLAMPFQVILLVPFLKLGQRIMPGHALPAAFTALNPAKFVAQATAAPLHTMEQMGGLFARALVAWLVTAGPALLLLTLLLTPVLHLLSKRAALQAE